MTLDQLVTMLRARGWACRTEWLGGNVHGIVVDVPGVPADQCVLVTVDDGQDEWTPGLGEVEVSANYHDGTVGLTEDNAGRRFVSATLDQTSGRVIEFVRFVSELGREAE